MSLCLCQQTPCQLDLPFACMAPTGGERVSPWGLLLCRPMSQTGSATVLNLADGSICFGLLHIIQDQQQKTVTYYHFYCCFTESNLAKVSEELLYPG